MRSGKNGLGIANKKKIAGEFERVMAATNAPSRGNVYEKLPRQTKLCANCGVSFATGSGGKSAESQLYCSVRCRNSAHVHPDRPRLCSGTMGALHELLVCADLLRRGMSVYRSMSQAAKADLIVVNGTSMARVEVTTGARNKNGNYSHPSKDRANFDVLAVVFHGGEIVYEPAWPQNDTQSLPAA